MDVSERSLVRNLRAGTTVSVRRISSDSGNRVFYMDAPGGRRVASFVLSGPDGALTAATVLVATDPRNLDVLRRFAMQFCTAGCDGEQVMSWLGGQASAGETSGSRRFDAMLVTYDVVPSTPDSLGFMRVTFDAVRGAELLTEQQQREAQFQLAVRTHDIEIAAFESGEAGVEQMRAFIARIRGGSALPADYRNGRIAQVSALLARRLLDQAQRLLSAGHGTGSLLAEVGALLTALPDEERASLGSQRGVLAAQEAAANAALFIATSARLLSQGDFEGASNALDSAVVHAERAEPATRSALEDQIGASRVRVAGERDEAQRAREAEEERTRRERDARVAQRLRSPAAAGVLSIVPGGGHAYNRRWGAAAGYLLTTSAAAGVGGWLILRGRSLEATYLEATDPDAAARAFDRAQLSLYSAAAVLGVGAVMYLVNIVHAVRRTRRWNAHVPMLEF
jgi:hypothetical protein